MKGYTYEVICGNIGTVYSGTSYTEACAKFDSYIAASKAECGRAGGEDVTMLADGDIKREYYAPRVYADANGHVEY